MGGSLKLFEKHQTSLSPELRFVFPSASFSDRNDDAVEAHILCNDLAAAKGHDPVHFFRHLRNAEERIFLAGIHAVKTCPHVFVAPSAVFAVIYVDADSFSHDPLPAPEKRERCCVGLTFNMVESTNLITSSVYIF